MNCSLCGVAKKATTHWWELLFDREHIDTAQPWYAVYALDLQEEHTVEPLDRLVLCGEACLSRAESAIRSGQMPRTRDSAALVPGDGPVRYELTFIVRRTDKPEAELRIEIPEFGEEVVRAENPVLNALLANFEHIYGPKPTATPAGEAEDGGATRFRNSQGRQPKLLHRQRRKRTEPCRQRAGS